MTQRSRRPTLGAFLLAGALAADGCEARPGSPLPDAALDALREATLPPELLAGEELYSARCSLCHGRLGLGTQLGPPLVHAVYAPRHHADEAFHIAVMRGMRAHHFRYGDMPPVPGLTRSEVDEIIRYVRWAQRTAGLDD